MCLCNTPSDQNKKYRNMVKDEMVRFTKNYGNCDIGSLKDNTHLKNLIA